MKKLLLRASLCALITPTLITCAAQAEAVPAGSITPKKGEFELDFMQRYLDLNGIADFINAVHSTIANNDLWADQGVFGQIFTALLKMQGADDKQIAEMRETAQHYAPKLRELTLKENELKSTILYPEGEDEELIQESPTKEQWVRYEKELAEVQQKLNIKHYQDHMETTIKPKSRALLQKLIEQALLELSDETGWDPALIGLS